MIDLLNMQIATDSDRDDEMKLIANVDSKITVEDMYNIMPKGYETTILEVMQCVEVVEDYIGGALDSSDKTEIAVWFD